MRPICLYFMNNDTLAESSKSRDFDGAIPLLKLCTVIGNHVLPVPGGYSLEVRESDIALFATLIQRDVIISQIGVAAGPDGADWLWPQLERLYHAMTDQMPHASLNFAGVKKPNQIPWCAVFNTKWASEPAHKNNLFNVREAIAWAWLESHPNAC